ncbi:ABC transporter ATP-binding protein [Alicyclobacillus kakegawensis]|uniref:ABC transporter ATP-binding protein n=1 Tax=Alicyclobacillus kakegawensis TaxID=392012 RepID=UPI00083264C4|nr:ABC transporter ATP-binding protein [Alicyclobacillus kakegawensis]
MLALCDVTKEFNFRVVLEDITLRLEAGQRYALRAPNGSGKTTLLRIMAGLTRPTRGRLLWSGRPMRVQDRRRMGVVLESPMLYGDLTVLENLVWFSRLYGLSQAGRCARWWTDAAGLTECAQLPVRQLSKGQRQRAAMARAFLHDPELILLDEPFDGLDEEAREWVGDVLDTACAAGKTVFLVTHEEETWAQADVGLTLHNGQLEVLQ